MIKEAKHISLFGNLRNSHYPSLQGLYHGALSLHENVDGTNLTDRLGLAGTLLIFPEFAPYSNRLQHIVTLGHQIDHYFDSGEIHDPKAIRNFNSLYPDLLSQTFETDKHLLRNMLGSLSHAMIVEKDIRKIVDKSLLHSNRNYRELINAIWVRMIVSAGSRSNGGITDYIGTRNYKTIAEVKNAYVPYIEGQECTGLPGGKRSHTLFLWTMAVQQKFDSLSRRENTLNGNPFMEKSNKDYAQLAIQAGVNPYFLHTSLKAIDLLPYLQRFQSF